MAFGSICKKMDVKDNFLIFLLWVKMAVMGKILTGILEMRREIYRYLSTERNISKHMIIDYDLSKQLV